MDAAAEVERGWRKLRIRFREPEDGEILAAYAGVRELALFLATGAVGAREAALLLQGRVRNLLELLHVPDSMTTVDSS